MIGRRSRPAPGAGGGLSIWQPVHLGTDESGRAVAVDLAERMVLLGGEPVGPRFIEWNFVASSKDRLEQAKADWRAGRMKLPDADDQEFIPLPEPSPPANPMS